VKGKAKAKPNAELEHVEAPVGAVSVAALLALQEYNICFTTVKRPTDGSMAALPTVAASGPGSSSSSLAPLPTVIQGLVRKRREVKAQMKSCRCAAVQVQPAVAGQRQHESSR
jgi:DNA polymerase elongation subunit (family B)